MDLQAQQAGQPQPAGQVAAGTGAASGIDVFISYSSKDVAAATALQQLLEARGLVVWRDQERLNAETTGQAYTPAIRKALDAARKVVVLWSPRSVASTWVKQEAEAALKARKLVPLLIEPCELPFPHALNHSIRVDSLDKQIDVIARAIGAEIPGGGLVTPPERIRYRLPTSAKTDELIGRDDELTKLFTAWDFGETRVFVLDAMGGTGKTALVNALVQGLEMTGWRGAEAVYTWSFYSQGAREESNISSDEFMKDALEWFGYAGEKPLAEMKSWEKGEALARLVAARRALLILDGIEPLQYPAHSPGLAGQIKQNDGLKELLDHLALHSKGLTVVTTRVPVVDLNGNPEPRVLRPRLQPLKTSHGVQLLRRLGVTGTQDELEHTVSGHADPARGWPEGFNGHALSLKLLGNYLVTVHGGDIRQRDKVPGLLGADGEQGGHAFRVMKAYEDHFESRIREQIAKGEKRERVASARQLSIAYVMGLFDRPVPAETVAFLRESRIAGLTEPLADLRDDQWKYAVDGLRKLGLLNRPHTGEDGREADDGSLDAHPLVREYFEMRLKELGAAQAAGGEASVYAEAHGRLYDYYRYLGLPEAFRTPVAYGLLGAAVGFPQIESQIGRAIAQRKWPESWIHDLPRGLTKAPWDVLDTISKLIGTPEFERAKRAFAPQLGRDGTASEILDRMGACFAAIAHGSKAGRFDEAFNEVYWPRVQRGNEKFASHKLGAHGADLAAVAQFFVEPFSKLAGRSDARPSGLSEADQALLFNLAGFALRAQGRLADAVAPARASAQLTVPLGEWERAASGFGTLSELLLTLGRVGEAGAAAEAAVAHAGRFAQTARLRQDIEDARFRRIAAAAQHADALAAAGQTAEAAALLDEAEVWQAERQPTLPLHYSLTSYRLRDLRLAQGRAREVVARTEYDLGAGQGQRSLLDIALATLSLGRAHAALARAGVRPSGSDTTTQRGGSGGDDELSRQGVRPGGSDAVAATRHLEDAVAKLREAGQLQYVPAGFIARAAWHRVCGAHELALDDLGKALDLAERSGMRLFNVDALIERARLALAMGDRKAASDHLLAACKIVGSTFFDESVSPPRRTETGYTKRDVDLHLLGAAICMTEDPATTAQALTEAAKLVEAGHWGSLDELAELWARSGLPDGGTIARLTAARAAFDAEADAAFETARNRGKSEEDDEDEEIDPADIPDALVDQALANDQFRAQLDEALQASNLPPLAQLPPEDQRGYARQILAAMMHQQGGSTGS